MSVVVQHRPLEADHARAAEVDHERKLQALLAALLGEFLNSALLAATTAGIGNFIERQETAQPKTSMLGSYLPPAPSLYPEARLQLSLLPHAVQTSLLLTDYYDRLRLLRELVGRWLPVSGPGGAEDTSIELARLAQGWRDLCADGIGIVRDFPQLLDPQLRQQSEHRCQMAADLLARAASGEAACIDARGNVQLPSWVERRASPRVRRGIRAYFRIDDSLQCVSVEDVSERGVGVLGMTSIAVGSRVSLLVKPGRSIEGRVVWHSGERAGIQLDEPLPPGSQLLAQLP